MACDCDTGSLLIATPRPVSKTGRRVGNSSRARAASNPCGKISACHFRGRGLRCRVILRDRELSWNSLAGRDRWSEKSFIPVRMVGEISAFEDASGNVIDWTLKNGQYSSWNGVGCAGTYAVVNK
jgi:hypothetical protein